MTDMRHLILLTLLVPLLSNASLSVQYLYDSPDVQWWPIFEPEQLVGDRSPSGAITLAQVPFVGSVQRLGDVPTNSHWLEQLQMPLFIQRQHQWLRGIGMRWGQTDDGKLVIDLDPDARWSDGVRISSADLVFSLQQQQRIAPINELSSIEIYSTQRVALSINHQYALAKDIAKLRLLPKHYYNALHASPDALRWQPEPTSGPYYVDSINPGRSVVIRRSPAWWAQSRPQFLQRFNIASVRLERIDSDQQWQALTRGELDWLTFQQDVAIPALQRHSQRYRMQLWQQPSSQQPYVILNRHDDQAEILKTQLNAFFSGHSAASIEFHPLVKLIHPYGQLHSNARLVEQYLQQQGFNTELQAAVIRDTEYSADIVLSHVQNASTLHLPHWPLFEAIDTTLAWEWVRLPHNAPSAKLFDITDGGFVYIDARQRNDILSRPQRRRPALPAIRTFNTLKPQTANTR